MKYTWKILVLTLTTFSLSAMANSEIKQGDNCRVEIQSRSNGAGEFKNIYIEFNQNRSEDVLAISAIFGVTDNDYHSLFTHNQTKDFDQYPYDLKGYNKNGRYQISFYTMKSINGETMNGYRHETLTFTFNDQKQLDSLQAEYSERWPFPRDLVDGETVVKNCRF